MGNVEHMHADYLMFPYRTCLSLVSRLIIHQFFAKRTVMSFLNCGYLLATQIVLAIPFCRMSKKWSMTNFRMIVGLVAFLIE